MMKTMPAALVDLARPYVHLQQVLTADDVAFLVESSRTKLTAEGIPCYTLIDRLEDTHLLKIRRLVEQVVGADLYYLNDFYIYTDASSATGWHMDTELFTFEQAINAWILLSPSHVDDPLGFIDGINDAADRFYHSVTVEDGECTFAECLTGRCEVRSVDDVEARVIHTPRVHVGDILLINPKRFHRTNVTTSKHSFAIKFVLRGPDGFLSVKQVPPEFWPEVAIFNRLIRGCERWDDVVAGIRQALGTPEGFKELSAGFYPERFDTYKRMISTL
jgi:hypothetical protein